MRQICQIILNGLVLEINDIIYNKSLFVNNK